MSDEATQVPSLDPLTEDSRKLQAVLQDFRSRIVRGDSPSDDELREAIRALQAHRQAAHGSLERAASGKATKAAERKTKAQKKQDALNLLGDLF